MVGELKNVSLHNLWLVKIEVLYFMWNCRCTVFIAYDEMPRQEASALLWRQSETSTECKWSQQRRGSFIRDQQNQHLR